VLAVDGSVRFTGTVRGCGTTNTVPECSTVTNHPVPEQHLTDLTGELCYCSSNHCNAASPVSVGRFTLVVVLLSALAAAASTLGE